MNFAKYQLKLRTKEEYVWIHFCYVPLEVKQEFDRKVNTRGWTNNDWVTRWARQQFGFRHIDEPERIKELREKIRAHYKGVYPEIYMDTPTDNQGWVRVWLTQNMRREVEEWVSQKTR